jgi:hypothetical protein
VCGGMKFGVYIGPVYPGDMDGASAFDLGPHAHPTSRSRNAREGLEAHNRGGSPLARGVAVATGSW